MEQATASEYDDDKVLSSRDSADYCGFSEQHFRKLRCHRRGPRYIKLGRTVKYRLSDLRDWLNAGVVETSN